TLVISPARLLSRDELVKMTNTPPGWVRDSGLDAHSVASMTPNEAKEYLALVIRYLPTSELPSLAWLRRATAASRKSGLPSNAWRADGGLTPYRSQSPDAANPASEHQKAVGLLQALLRRAPVDFRSSRSSEQNPRRLRATRTPSSGRRRNR